jgi:hypothetical protein
LSLHAQLWLHFFHAVTVSARELIFIWPYSCVN